jgi:hypothetical protein
LLAEANMRFRHLLIVVALLVPVVAPSQSTPRQTNPERFDVSGLPQAASSTLEKEIFMLLRYHRRGDLRDATRIHLKLAEYYKELGDKTRADDCTKLASEAWDAAEKGIRTTAGTSGTPPFEPLGSFRRNFAYSDESLGVSHRWEFFDDGTFAHSLSVPPGQTAAPPKELGWYTLLQGQVRLWQPNPAVDRTVTFELLGAEGQNGVVLDGIRMRAVR